MNSSDNPLMRAWYEVLPRLLPFADVATKDLPLLRLLRLSLFQVSVGMAVVLLTGTLNRVMVLELDVPVWLVALMVSLPLVFAPLRAMIGHRSDHHRSAFGLRRVPYIWMGSLLQFGGFAVLPYAILVLADPGNNLAFIGRAAAAISFLLVGAGLHTIQTAGLALATDLAPPDKRPRVVALLYVTLLLGMVCSALLFGYLLQDFNPAKLIGVVQGAAVATIFLNLIALWKQEAIDLERAECTDPAPPFADAWRSFMEGGRSSRLLVVVGLGTAGFTMQDILLEPYGGEILGLSVSQTTMLTAILAGGTLAAFALSARVLTRGGDAYRLSGIGAVIGVLAFSAVIVAALLESVWAFRGGAALIGFGAGLFAVGTLTAAMALADEEHTGLALGAWGAVQATAMGVAIALGGAIKNIVSGLATEGVFGPAFTSPVFGYGFVYSIEILLLITTLIVILPLILARTARSGSQPAKLGLDQMP